MVRGHAKAVSQEKAAAKNAAKAKSAKRDPNEVIAIFPLSPGLIRHDFCCST
jgi:hypothetical protein